MKNENHILFVERCKIIDEVITLQEACVILGCADSTLRKKVLSGKFKEGEYRKAKGTILFYKGAIEEYKLKKK
jgi:hypothetical protein